MILRKIQWVCAESLMIIDQKRAESF